MKSPSSAVVRETPSTSIALANVFPPGILLPMLRRAGDAPNQMTDTVKVEPALDLSINQVAQGPIRFVSQRPLGALAPLAVLLGDGS